MGIARHQPHGGLGAVQDALSWVSGPKSQGKRSVDGGTPRDVRELADGWMGGWGDGSIGGWMYGLVERAVRILARIGLSEA